MHHKSKNSQISKISKFLLEETICILNLNGFSRIIAKKWEYDMARIENTVFISYRRTDVYTALAVYENLKNQGYDVFFDYRSISSGDFEQIIISSIRARAHFILILTPTALDRCSEPEDWLRREIELAIDEKRNIVPLFFKDFRFGTSSVSEKLTGKLRNLSHYNGLNVHEDYFDEGMDRLRTQYLNIPLNTVLHPMSTEVQKVVNEEQIAADNALKQNEHTNKPAKQINEKLLRDGELLKTPVTQTIKSDASLRAPQKVMPYRLIVGIMAVLALLIMFLIWGGGRIWNSRFDSILESTSTSQLVETKTPLPSETSAPPTPVLDIGSTRTGIDGMTLLYVPAGDFTMGTKAEDALAQCLKTTTDCQLSQFTDEDPPHQIFLNTYWIDQTEVTNAMYAKCVQSDYCQPPESNESYTRDSYYGNSEFDNYPVIQVDWNKAKAYCDWAGRRLPTEAEWEKAARGEDGNIYPWGSEFDGTRVNFCDKNCPYTWAINTFDDGFADTSPVDNYPKGASPYGVFDMAGNVWEWTSDWYDTYPGGDPNARSQYGQKYRVFRGGSWGYYDSIVRSAYRGRGTPDLATNFIGFRCATYNP